ncbi:SusC/RagA family TonB-linked outer membrane protein [Parapedobacter koreensis]|uniref:TonB-linked outer membrane protein, SusC/RagA family n=1 Tax=Parapedobacter koreensis TaxID=332977 RepID=A0A1H7IK98_9SPHI|nr:SusC/RagA family TonB-linked outer membrane protein [Parapedobacter koreensis]SEK62921.1 TonB-linked outer membrane protein, SusC/RagA family [Parapedobacter koreensis]
MKQRLLCFFMLGILLIGSAYAQDRRISGRVTAEEDGNPIAGVSVLAVGANIAAQTDDLGTFTIDVPSSVTSLEFRYLGYISQTVSLGSNTNITVALATDATALSEVVVTGYGTQRRSEITGSTARVSGAAVADRPLQSFSQGLTGQAAGVNIVQPNGLLNNPPVIRVRGLSSLTLSSFPLVVVDGIPISTNDVSPNSATNNPLADINPSDIESIDILKDAASAAIYGSRAAAGVLLITTKRGKAGEARVTYDGWFGINNAVRLPEVLNAQQYMDHKNAAIDRAYEINPSASLPPRNAFQPSYDANGNLIDTDWQDLVYRTAYSQNHNVTVSGGGDKTVYYFSAGITDQDGFLRENSFQRKSARFNVDHKVTNWLKFLGNVSYTNSMNKSPNSGSDPGSAFNSSGLGRIAVAQAPNVGPYNEDGSYNVQNASIGWGANQTSLQFANPEVLIKEDKNSSENNRLFANLGAEVQLAEGLSFRTSYTWDFRLTEDIQFWNPINGDGYSPNGSATNRNTRANNWNWINTLQYQKSFNGIHNLNVSLSTDAQKQRTQNWGANRQGLIDPFFNQFQGTYNINNASGNGITQLSYMAYIAIASYNYANKYFISGNFRRDGNSGLARGNQWGNFGGASVAWGISQEEFYKNSSLSETVSNLRFKASWGRVGNGNVGAYNEYSTYGSGIYGGAPTWAFNRAGNSNLSWETSQQTNIGVDIGLFNDKIIVEANWFNKDIDNMILDVPQAPSKGIPNNEIRANVGSMYNRGWEFSVSASPISKENFRWTTNLNLGLIKNEVTSLVTGQQLAFSTGGLELSNVTVTGHSAASLYGVRVVGVNPENGRQIFLNGDGEQVQYLHLGGASAWTYLDGSPAVAPNTTPVVLGGTIPTWSGGFNNSFQYKNFDLALNFTFSGGNYIYNGSRAGLLDQRVWNNSVEVLNAWTAIGQQTDIPMAVWGDNVSNGSAWLIDSNIEKGDFLRLQTATVGYRLPTTLFGNSGINSARIYASVNNAFILTNYTGVDPEISSNGGDNLGSGIERNTIPQGRAFTFGVNIGF